MKIKFGIIGCGRIGTYVSKLLSSFGCSILGYDPYIKEHDICRMVELEELIIKSSTINEVFEHSKKVQTAHVPIYQLLLNI